MRKIVRNVGVVAVAAATLTMSLALSTGTANAATTKKTPACKAKDVTFSTTGTHNSWDENDVASYIFIKVNKGRTCHVKGFLTKIQLVDASGKAHPIKTERDTVGRKKPGKIKLVSEDQAEIDLRWKKPTEGEQTVEPAAIKFRLPGDKHVNKVAWQAGHLMLSAPLLHAAALPYGN